MQPGAACNPGPKPGPKAGRQAVVPLLSVLVVPVPRVSMAAVASRLGRLQQVPVPKHEVLDRVARQGHEVQEVQLLSSVQLLVLAVQLELELSSSLVMASRESLRQLTVAQTAVCLQIRCEISITSLSYYRLD